MSQKVASLYAEIGAKTDGFEKGASKVKAELHGLVPGIESARTSIGGFVSANAGLIGVLAGVGAGIGVAIKDTMRYAGEVRDLSIATGGTAEESSRLLQVLDDYEITAADVTAGMRAMKEKGLTPTIGTLQQLSEQFLAIQDPAQRLQFAQDNLGRSYSKFLNVLSQGPDKIKELNGAVNSSLILTDEQIRKSEEARLAMDAWGDAVMGAKVQVATGLLPVLDAFDNSEKELALSLGLTGREADRFAMSILSMKNDTDSATQSYTAWAASLKDVGSELEDTTEATAELAKSNASLIQGAIAATEADEDYRKKQEEIQLQIEELTAAKADMYPWEKSQIQETQDKIDELSAAYDQNAEDYRAAMEKKFALMAVEKIAMEDGVEGYSQGEFEKARAILETTDVATAAMFDQQQGMEALTSAVASGKITTQQYGNIMRRAMADGKVSLQEIQEAMDEVPGNIAKNADKMVDYLHEPIGSITTLNEKIEATASKSGMMWDYYFNIHTTGHVPNLPSAITMEGGAGGVNQQLNYSSANTGAARGPSLNGSMISTNSQGEGWGFTNNGTINVYANNPGEFMDALTGGL